jgi:hypothetical protein
MMQLFLNSVADPHHFDATTAAGKNVDAATASAPALALLVYIITYTKPTF